MRTAILALLLAAAGATIAPAHAQSQSAAAIDPARLAAAKDVLVATHAQDLMAKSTGQMADQIFDGMRKQMLAKDDPSDPYYGERVRRMTNVVKAEMSAMMTDITPQLLDMSANIYAREFSVAELRGIAAFYRGPVGQAFVDKMPAIMRDLGQAMGSTMLPMISKRMEALKPKLTAAIADLPPPSKAK